MADCRFEARQLETEADKRGADYAAFKSANGLSRDAGTSTHDVANIAFVACIVTLESLLNAFNFSAASRAGVVGGLYAAGAISLINALAAAYFAAPGLRLAHHRKWPLKFAGAQLFAFAAAIAIAINLFAGHYRAAIEADPASAGALAWGQFTTNAVNIPSAHAWMLTMLGFMANVAVAMKVFMSDDRYPGFGAVFRLWRHARERIAALRGQSLGELAGALSAHQKAADRLARRAGRALADLESPGHRFPFLNSTTGISREDLDDRRRLKIELRRLLEQDIEAVKKQLLTIHRDGLASIEAIFAIYGGKKPQTG